MKNLSIAPDREEIQQNYTQEDIDQIVKGLVDGTIKVETVPEYIHPKLYVPLSLAKNEAKLGGLSDKYNHINDVMWSMKFSLVKPDKSMMPTMTVTGKNKNREVIISSRELTTRVKPTETQTVPLITAVTGFYDENTASRKFNGERSIAHNFWETERKRLINLQEKEFQDLKKKHKSTPIPKDENEAKRVYDSFELELADFRTKWQRKMQKFEQEKNEELNSIQQELNVSVVRPISPEPILDPYEKIGKYNATILAQKERERLIQEESEKEAFNQTIESPKKFSQTMQPRSSPQKLSQTMKPKQSPKQTARLATTVKKK